MMLSKNQLQRMYFPLRNWTLIAWLEVAKLSTNNERIMCKTTSIRHLFIGITVVDVVFRCIFEWNSNIDGHRMKYEPNKLERHNQTHINVINTYARLRNNNDSPDAELNDCIQKCRDAICECQQHDDQRLKPWNKHNGKAPQRLDRRMPLCHLLDATFGGKV